MNHFDEQMPHKKKSKKKPPKKSDHKHDYELVEKDESLKNWFTHKYVCKICGKENTEFRIKK